MIAFVFACFAVLAVLVLLAYREVRRQNLLIGNLCAALQRRPTRGQIEQIIETTRAAAGATAAARAIDDPSERREA